MGRIREELFSVIAVTKIFWRYRRMRERRESML